MKYLYPYECERKGLSSPGELQAAIDSNRREGRRPSYSSSLFRFSPSPSTAPHILSPPKMHLSALGAGVLNGLQSSPGPSLKKEDLTPSMLGVRSNMAMALGQQQVAGLARAATLEQLREKLETGGSDGPERKMARLAEEQQRLMQQAFQHNLLAMASQVPMNLRLAAPSITTRDEKPQDMSLSISTSGNASITVSVEVNGTLYSGTLFAQKSGGSRGPTVSAAPVSVAGAGTSSGFVFSAPTAQTLSPASSSSSSKGPGSAEPAAAGAAAQPRTVLVLLMTAADADSRLRAVTLSVFLPLDGGRQVPGPSRHPVVKSYWRCGEVPRSEVYKSEGLGVALLVRHAPVHPFLLRVFAVNHTLTSRTTTQIQASGVEDACGVPLFSTSSRTHWDSTVLQVVVVLVPRAKRTQN
ncbi:hypothetical protein CRUP_025603 [Coryphaenoides rupestris]|nr:hypothetical protein CRUP_025603 [Coryphaenoides rupestris]